MKYRYLCAIAALFIAVALAPQVKADQKFTGTEFLTWEAGSRLSYIQTSVTMAVFTTSKRAPDMSKCLNDWYYDDMTAANNDVLASIRKFPEYHPTAIIAAKLEKVCGKF